MKRAREEHAWTGYLVNAATCATMIVLNGDLSGGSLYRSNFPLKNCGGSFERAQSRKQGCHMPNYKQ